MNLFKNLPLLWLIILACSFTSCNSSGPYDPTEADFIEAGIASWYGDDYHGKPTANGEIYNMEALTAAHRTLPFNSIVHVVNKDNGRTVTVRINDRGPFVEGRVIDLSRRAAREIGIITVGLARVELFLVEEGG